MKKTLLTLVLTLIGIHTTFAQIGIGTTSPDASAQLELQSTAKGFLPPRMDTDARDGIGSPAEGLTIYNTDNKCLEFFTSDNDWISACDGSVVTSPPQPQSGSNFTNGFQDNQTCENKLISVTPCSAIDGASINDDPDTADGIEYDWADADNFMNGGTTRALVEIGGQCWFKRNTISKPVAPISAEPNVEPNEWGEDLDMFGVGLWGYYDTSQTSYSDKVWGTSEPEEGEGLLYQFRAAMNDSTTERAQGVCPADWHIPSDCEWMYLENTLGMSIPKQETSSVYRQTTGEGTKIKENGSSGFTALFPGYGNYFNGRFTERGAQNKWWSSSESSIAYAYYRQVSKPNNSLGRSTSLKGWAYSVRCLKD